MLIKNEDCDRGLHVFQSSKAKSAPKFPRCIYCGAEAVDWERTRARNPEDIAFVISELQKSRERYDMWIAEIDLPARNHALRKGRLALRGYVRKRLFQMIGRVYDTGDTIMRPYRDGFQTPYAGNVVYYAQHAVACCCRPCTERWHGIPQGRDLTEEELDYLAQLVMVYIDTRLSELEELGVPIPPLRGASRNRKASRKAPVSSVVQLGLDLNDERGNGR